MSEQKLRVENAAKNLLLFFNIPVTKENVERLASVKFSSFYQQVKEWGKNEREIPKRD